MLKSFKYEIFPNEYQKEVLANLFGLNRLVWNQNLANWNQNHEDRKSGKLADNNYYKVQNYKPILSSLNNEDINKTLKTYNAGGWIASSSQNLSKALNNCFSKKRKKNTKFPKFKSKHKRQSVTNCMCVGIKFRKGNEIWVSKNLGWIKFDNHRFVEGKIQNTVTISFENDRYYISILTEVKQKPKNQNNKAIGIDWNCRDDAWLTLSNDMKIKCPRFMLTLQGKLIKAQKILSRRFKQGAKEQSNNYYKQKHKISKLYRKIANQRKDFLWKLAKDLCNQYGTIVFENINLQTMAKSYKHKGLNHGKVIADQGFGLFRTLCEYFGNVKYVPSAYTSKKCSHCGEIANFVRVGIDEWVCPNCGTKHDRDINAAKNILQKYLDTIGWELPESTLAESNPIGPRKSRKTRKQENPKTILELCGSK